MNIGRSTDWYRPYGVTVNGKKYLVNQICFYQDGDILCSSASGWLENANGNDIDSIELPVEEIKLKRKEKFDGTIFAMTHREPYDSETRVNLYIPAEIFDVHFVENRLEHHRTVCAIYEGSNGIFIRKYIKSIDNSLYAIRNEYEEVYKKVTDTNLAVVSADLVLENLDKLKELALQFIEERKRIHELTIDDIDLTEG